MDIDNLLRRHARSLKLAVTAPTREARFVHGALAGAYADRIGEFRAAVAVPLPRAS